MIDEIARGVFGALCHQQPDRSWLLGETLLPLCARCTGVYAGAALAVAAVSLLPRRRPRMLILLAALGIAQMVVLGQHLLPMAQAPWLRTLSGQLFAIAVVTLLVLPLRRAVVATGRCWAWFALASLSGIALLQAALIFGTRAAALAIEGLALTGAAALPILMVVSLVIAARRALLPRSSRAQP